MSYRLIHGDCIETMRNARPESIDAIVCDPPYGLKFMGKEWDGFGTPLGFQTWNQAWATEALKVLKPGGHLLAFGGTRMYHRLASGLEDAGFEIRDSILWGHMRHIFCQCPTMKIDGRIDLLGVRQEVPDASGMAQASEKSDVQQPMQRRSTREGLGEIRSFGQSGMDGFEPRELPAENVGSVESSMEGRGNPQATEGELSVDPICSRAGVVIADGEEGSIHSGTSDGNGHDVRTTTPSLGSSASPGSQSAEQQSGESGNVALEWIPQGGGAWPACGWCGLPLAPPFDAGPLSWQFGSGFPKSHNVALSIDKMNGHKNRGRAIPTASRFQASDTEESNLLTSKKVSAYEAQSDDAQGWEGWGTALKPAYEPVIVARKPFKGTVAKNVLAYGTGALNIDGCRIPLNGDYKAKPNGRPSQTGLGDNYDPENANQPDTVGRWPANVILDEEAGALLDEQTGTLTSGKVNGGLNKNAGNNIYGDYGTGNFPDAPIYGDSGGASRFFYCAKVSKKEREAGLDDFEEKMRGLANQGMQNMDGGTRQNKRKNSHPTVKPIELMRYLCRLVTPPNGVVLDPFMGSGSTGIAAILEGFKFVGIEQDEEYFNIAQKRIEHWKEQG